MALKFGNKSKVTKYHIKVKEWIIFLGLSQEGCGREALKGSLVRGVLMNAKTKQVCFADLFKTRDLFA